MVTKETFIKLCKKVEYAYLRDNRLNEQIEELLCESYREENGRNDGLCIHMWAYDAASEMLVDVLIDCGSNREEAEWFATEGIENIVNNGSLYIEVDNVKLEIKSYKEFYDYLVKCYHVEEGII